ncbi:MAG: hypothetical protein NTV86_20375 [Planctomycetota bacterium]|nr:hypothetical protein [Planctomycetota bacterium]
MDPRRYRAAGKAGLALAIALGGWVAVRSALGPPANPRMTCAQPPAPAPLRASQAEPPAPLPPPVVPTPALPEPTLQTMRTYHDAQHQLLHEEYTLDPRTQKPEGLYVRYKIANGQSYLYCKGLYRCGRHHGLWAYYYPSGRLQSQLTFAMGTRHGPWKSYRASGELQESKEYIADRLDGPYTSYHPNGQVRFTGMYNSDQRNGKWVKYDAAGRLAAEAFFDAGRSVGVWKTYRPDGRVLATIRKRGQVEGDPHRENASF